LTFFGFGSAITSIVFTNIVVGTPNPSNFAVPSGVCIQVGPESEELPKVEFSKLFQVPRPKTSPFQKDMDKLDTLYSLSKKLDNHILRERETVMKRNAHAAQQDLPPQLNQAFTASWTLNASVSLTPPFTAYMIYGELAFDLTTSGLAFSVSKIEGNIPIDLQFEARMSPTRNGIEFLQVGPDKKSCYSYLFLQWIFSLLIPQFQIPYDSINMDPAKVNGDLCSVWQTTYQWYGMNPSILYVRQSDNTLVQMTLPEPFLGMGMATLTLSNVKDSVDPSLYSRPDSCIETMTWNPSWQSHLPWDWCDPWC